MTKAEALITLAQMVTDRPGTVDLYENMETPDMELGTLFARVKLAIVFTQKPADFRFRAIMEEWDAQRIIQEMY